MTDGRLLGMALVFGASCWTGLQAAAGVRRRSRQLAQLRLSLELMRCEIACRKTPLRALCGTLEKSCKGEIAALYRRLGQAMTQGAEIPEAAKEARSACRLTLPSEIEQSLDGLFSSFGGFDTDGQLRMIELTQTRVAAALETLSAEQAQRCRSYTMLGLCAGAALVILAA